MEYKELKKEAAKLGINPVGVKTEELAKKVEEAKATNPKAKAKPETPKDANTAIVLRGSDEIRRYTSQDHGKKFAELASQFADKRGYTVSFTLVDFDKKCPHCGHQL
jgi:hypothetical protein